MLFDLGGLTVKSSQCYTTAVRTIILYVQHTNWEGEIPSLISVHTSKVKKINMPICRLYGTCDMPMLVLRFWILESDLGHS